MATKTTKSLIDDLSSIDRAIAFRVQKLGRLLRVQLLQAFQRRGIELTPEQFQVLFRLHEDDGQVQSALADQVLNDHPNITRLIDKMVKQKLVKRVADQQDRRKSRVYLLPAGKSVFRQLTPVILEERRRLYHGITAREQRQLLATLARIEANVKIVA